MDNKEPFDREKFIEAVGILAQAWENAFRGAIVGVNNMLANTAPSAVVFAPNQQLYVFYTTTIGGPPCYNINCMITTDGVNWTGGPGLTGGSGSPAAILYNPMGAYQIFVFFTFRNPVNGVFVCGYSWSTYESGSFGQFLGSTIEATIAGITGDPSVILYSPSPSTTAPCIYLFHQGPNQDNQVWYNTLGVVANDGSWTLGWGTDTQVANAVVSEASSPTAAVFAPGTFFDDMAASTDIYIGTPY